MTATGFYSNFYDENKKKSNNYWFERTNGWGYAQRIDYVVAGVCLGLSSIGVILGFILGVFK